MNPEHHRSALPLTPEADALFDTGNRQSTVPSHQNGGKSPRLQAPQTSGRTGQIDQRFPSVRPLQLEEAKQQFSAVAERAAGGQPQIVTKHGKPYVVIVSVADWQKFKPLKRSLLELLRSCPGDLTELELSRSKELPRDVGQ